MTTKQNDEIVADVEAMFEAAKQVYEAKQLDKGEIVADVQAMVEAAE